MTKIEILEREIRSQRNSVRNGLDNRVYHPTFGYTKAGLRRDLHTLGGLIIAHRIVADDDCPANPGSQINDYARRVFDIDLDALSQLITAS